MVNASKVLKARKSKRQPLKLKHKIERKVREHHRKQRKEAKRNPNKFRKKKDPGIPNSWPFKQQLLLEQEAQRVVAAEAQKEAREARKRERAEQKRSQEQLERLGRDSAKERRKVKRRTASFAPLHEVLAAADVVLLVLDARDPMACRSTALEQALIECKKLPILLLNKADLVPRSSLAAWLTALRSELPALATTCANEATHEASGMDVLCSVLEGFANDSRPAAASSSLKVGVVGFDGVGKRSLLKVLRTAKLPAAVSFLAMPARLQPLSSSMGVNDVLLRKCAPEVLAQPELLVGEVLARCSARSLLRHFQIPKFNDDEGFLRAFTAKAAVEAALPVVPDFDSRAAAVAALKHWCLGKMSFFTATPAPSAGASRCSLLKESVWMRLCAGDATLGLAEAESEEHVQLTAGVSEQIDLGAEMEGEWDGDDVAALADGQAAGAEEVERDSDGDDEDADDDDEDADGDSADEDEEVDEADDGEEGDDSDG